MIRADYFNRVFTTTRPKIVCLFLDYVSIFQIFYLGQKGNSPASEIKGNAPYRKVGYVHEAGEPTILYRYYR